MKRIFLVGLFGLFLTGCGEDKFTKEYLVGKWDCKLESYADMKINGKLTKYLKTDNFVFTNEFKIYDNKLFIFNEISKEWKKIDSIDNYFNGTNVDKTDNFVNTSTTSVKKKSENEFHIKIETTSIKTDTALSDDEHLEFKEKLEGFCTRIKWLSIN